MTLCSNPEGTKSLFQKLKSLKLLECVTFQEISRTQVDDLDLSKWISDSGIHIRPRLISARNPNSRFTASGLGDRIHLLTVAWALQRKYCVPINLHLSSSHYDQRKKESYLEIVKLFPTEDIRIQFHSDSSDTESDWNTHLRSLGVNSITWHYRDYRGWNETLDGFDASKLLRTIPLIVERNPQDRVENPYVTWQFDSTGIDRRLSKNREDEVRNYYLKLGYSITALGGEATDKDLKTSLQLSVEVMSKSKWHVGVDSGFYHLAQIVLPPNEIHLYNNVSGYWSHHAFRGIDNGVKVNVACGGLPRRSRIRIGLRHDSRLMLKSLHWTRSRIDKFKRGN